MCTSRLIHSDAASFDDGASVRFATSPNSTRSAARVPRPAPPAGRQPGPDRPDPEALPHPVEHVGAAVGPRFGELQALARGGGYLAGVHQTPELRGTQAGMSTVYSTLASDSSPVKWNIKAALPVRSSPQSRTCLPQWRSGLDSEGRV